MSSSSDEEKEEEEISCCCCCCCCCSSASSSSSSSDVMDEADHGYPLLLDDDDNNIDDSNDGDDDEDDDTDSDHDSNYEEEEDENRILENEDDIKNIIGNQIAAVNKPFYIDLSDEGITEIGIKNFVNVFLNYQMLTNHCGRNHALNSSSGTNKRINITTKITELNLDKNKINDMGCKAICQFMKSNTTIKKILLWENNIGDQGMKYIADGLISNRSLTFLSLNSNKIGNTGCIALANALKVNSTLKELTMDWNNNIDFVGCRSLSDVLEYENTTVTYLSLSNRNSMMMSSASSCLVHLPSFYSHNKQDKYRFILNKIDFFCLINYFGRNNMLAYNKNSTFCYKTYNLWVKEFMAICKKARNHTSFKLSFFYYCLRMNPQNLMGIFNDNNPTFGNTNSKKRKSQQQPQPRQYNIEHCAKTIISQKYQHQRKRQKTIAILKNRYNLRRG